MKVLAIIDEQYDFTSGALGNAECEATVPAIVSYIEEHIGEYEEVWLPRDTHQENYLETQEGRKLPVVHCIENTSGWEVREEIVSALEHQDVKMRYFNKPTFGSVQMAQFARETYDREGSLTVDICGVCTGICDLSNGVLIRAFSPETEVRMIEKLCACVTPETHMHAIEAAKTLQIDMI